MAWPELLGKGMLEYACTQGFTLFNIHMNFDHVWAERYPVTLMPNNKIFLAVRVIRASTVLETTSYYKRSLEDS